MKDEDIVLATCRAALIREREDRKRYQRFSLMLLVILGIQIAILQFK